MLVDIPDRYLNNDATGLYARLRGVEGVTSRRLAEGVYEAHTNWAHEIESLILTPYTFMDEMRDAMHAGVRLDWSALPQDFGVCDHWRQVVVMWPELLSDSRRFVLHVTPIVRADQHPQGGWRWHKWGPYIGAHEVTHEYLYDQPEIERVYAFQLYQLR